MHMHSTKNKADGKLLTKTRLYEALPMCGQIFSSITRHWAKTWHFIPILFENVSLYFQRISSKLRGGCGGDVNI